MVYNDKKLKTIRKKLRANQTDAEKHLWKRLRKKQLGESKFIRQYSIGNIVVDFYCPSSRLAIELDGGQHNDDETIKKDQAREKYLKRKNISTLRFWNNDVLKNIDTVLESILIELKSK